MGRKQGRWPALGTLLAGIPVLWLGGRSLLPLVEEEWHLLHVASKDRAVRRAALEGLCEVGGTRSVPALLEVLRTEDRFLGCLVAPRAVQALVRIGKGEKQVSCSAPYDYAEPRFFPWAVRRVAQAGIDASAYLPPLLEQVICASPQIDAEEAVAAIGRPAIPFLLEAAFNTWQVFPARRGALETLSRMGPAGSPAVPPLLDFLLGECCAGDRLSSLAYPAADAIGGIGGCAATLIRLLEEGGAAQRQAAAYALRQLGAEEAQVVPALARALRDGHPQVRAAAAEALGDIGEPAREAVPELIEALLSPGFGEGEAMVTVAIGRECIPGGDGRWHAVVALMRIAPRDAGVKAAFRWILDHDTGWLLRVAAVILTERAWR